MKRVTLIGTAAAAAAVLALMATPVAAAGDDFVKVSAGRRHAMLMGASGGQSLSQPERCYEAFVVKGARNWGSVRLRYPPPSGCRPSDGGTAIVKQRATGRWVLIGYIAPRVPCARLIGAPRAVRAAFGCAS